MPAKISIVAFATLTLSLSAVSQRTQAQSAIDPSMPESISELEAESLNADEMKETRGQVIDKYRPRPRNCIWGICSGDWDDRLGPLMYRPESDNTTYRNH